MSQRKSDLSRKIKACTTTYPAAFLDSLPSACQQLFTNKSHLEVWESFCIAPVDSIGGSSRLVPAVDLPKYELDVVTYYELDASVKKTDNLIGKLSLLGIKNLYSPYAADVKPLIGGFLTVLNAYCTPQQFNRSIISEALVMYDVQPQKITQQQLDLYFRQEWNTFAQNIAIRPVDHKDFYKFAIVIGLSSLLFLGKTVRSENIGAYLNDKWQTLASHVGCNHLNALKPNVKICNFLHNCLSNGDRKAIFDIYRSLSIMQQDDRFRRAFGFIVESLSWADMEYIHLIDKYVVEKNPDLLSFSFQTYFASEKVRMKYVYKLMEQLPQSDHPFLKLLLPYRQLIPITRTNFKYLYEAARAVASVEDPSISYTSPEDTFDIINMKSHIRNCILAKKSQGTYRG